MKKDKFEIQEDEYKKPYHHLVSFEKDYKQHESLSWGLEYYSYVNWILGYIKKYNGNKIAEIGCGDGKILLEAAKMNPNKQFSGFDLSKKAISFAKAFSFGKNNLKFYECDFSKDKKVYDLIICIEVLEHIPDNHIKSFVKNLYCHLSENGKLIISVPTTAVKITSKHYRHYNLALLKEQIRDFFKISEYYYLHKENIYYKLIKNLMENRLFILKERYLSNLMRKLYLINCSSANERNGSHLLAICKAR